MNISVATIEWVGESFQKLPVFFDCKNRLVDAFHDYVVEVADEKRREHGSETAYRSIVDAVTYALLDWLRHLEDARLDWESADDVVLEMYRDDSKKRIKHSKRSKNSDRAAKRTMNVRLRWIYRFYCWAQKYGYCKNLIGPSQPIRSTLPQNESAGERISKRSTEKTDYPLCFPRVDRAKRGTPRHFASDKHKRNILKLFAESSDPFLAERNRLLLELTSRVGWRAGTLQGLLIGDFRKEKLDEDNEDGVTIYPSVQKFDFGGGFTVPHTLAARIARFIEKREAWLKERGWDEKRAENRLFISVRGTPLGNKTISQLFGDAFRKIGIPAKQGAGHHSFRRKFAKDAQSDELNARRQLGLSTAAEDLAFAQAQRLGHRSVDSQEAYQLAVSNTLSDSEPFRLRAQINELESEIYDRDREIAELKTQLNAATTQLYPKKKKRTNQKKK